MPVLNPRVPSHITDNVDHLMLYSLFTHTQGGGIRIDGSADLTDCSLYNNVARDVSFRLNPYSVSRDVWSRVRGVVGRVAEGFTSRARQCWPTPTYTLIMPRLYAHPLNCP